MALLELDDVDWIQLDTLRVDHTEYGTMELPPGTYCVEMGKLFGVSVLVDPRMWVEHTATGKVRVEPGRTYRLAADRSTGPGYTVSFTLVDVVADTTIPVQEEPKEYHVTGSITSGTPVTGTLDARDSTRYDCSPYEAYSLEVGPDQRVAITLESDEFDPFLTIVSPSGRFFHSEDAQAGRRKVRIERELAERGRWIVIANTFAAREGGRYRLVIEAR